MHIVCPGLSPIVLQNLPDPDALYPVCQLYMMQHEHSKPILYNWEVKLFLLEHIRFQSMLRLKDPKDVFLIKPRFCQNRVSTAYYLGLTEPF